VYQRREPGAKVFWGLIVIIAVATSASTLLTPAYLGGLLGAAGFSAAFVAIFNANAIGMTGPAFGFEAVALHGRASLRAYFAGLNLASTAVAVPLFTVLMFVLALVAKHPIDGFLALTVNFAGLGSSMALGNVLAVLMPYPVEKRAGSPTPKAMDGYRGATLAGTFISLFGTALLVAPAVLAVVFTRNDANVVRMPLLLIGAMLYALVLATVGVRLAATLSVNRLPELTEIAVRSKL
jgi:hypothetical protein